MAQSQIWTEENANWVRVARLLMDEGSRVVRKELLCEFEKQGYHSLESALNEPQTKDKIRRMYKPGKHSKKILSDAEHDSLYPGGNACKDINSLDLTLSCKLLFSCTTLRDTESTTKEPDATDISPGADIVRLKLMRNQLYGHICIMELSATEFKTAWANCEAVLLRLRVKPKRIHKIKNSLLDYTKFQEYKDKLAKEMGQDIEQMTAEMNVVKYGTDPGETLPDISVNLGNINDSFKILVLNTPSCTFTEEERKNISAALGYVPWNVIIDTDSKSRKGGLHDYIAASYQKRKAFAIRTHLELGSVPEDELQNIADGDKGVWILMNGCEHINTIQCFGNKKEYSKTKTRLTSLLQSIFQKFHIQKKIFLFIMILGSANFLEIKDIAEKIEDTCNIAEDNDHVDLEKSLAVTITVQNDAIDSAPSPGITLFDNQSCIAPINQVVTFLGNHFPSDTTEIAYIYPGLRGECSLRHDELLHVSPYIQLFHKSYGQIDLSNTDVNEIEMKLYDIRRNYLKGDILTPEALFLNKTGKWKVYIDRREMKEAFNQVETTLQQMRKRFTALLKLTHEPSSGGSTTCKHILYNLKDVFPCVFINKFNIEKIVEFVKLLYSNSLKILVIAMDDTHSEHEARILQTHLENKRVKALIILVQVTFSNTRTRRDDNCQSVHIPSKLSNNEDKCLFRSLYEEMRKSEEQNARISASNVFLFGLYAFCEEFTKINTHIDTCVNNLSFKQKMILKLTAFSYKYGLKAIHIGLVERILTENKESSDMTTKLGLLNDLTVTSKTSLTLAHDCIKDQLIERLTSDDKRRQLDALINTIEYVFSKDTEIKRDSQTLVVEMFIDPKRESGQSFSNLVYAYNEIGQEYAVEMLGRLEDLLKDTPQRPHFRMLKARYYMWIREPDSAITCINEAIGIKHGDDPTKTKCKDNIILYAYGNLYRKYILFTKEKRLSQFQNEDAFLDWATNNAKMAINALELSQRQLKRNKYNARAFIEDAKTRHLVLYSYWELKCKGNHETFMKFMEKKATLFLKECKRTGIQVLDKLDNLIRWEKIQEENSTWLHSSIVETKFDLLKLDFDKDVSIAVMFSTIPVQTPCDIGTMVREENNLRHKNAYAKDWGKKRNWAEMDMKDLRLIVTFIEQKLSAEGPILYNNYRDMLMAMVSIRNLPGRPMRNINLRYATEIAQQWTEKHKDSIEAQFFVGCFVFVDAVERHDKGRMHEALDYFLKCRNLCERNPAIPNYNRKQFVIGRYSGLGKLIPFNTFYNKPELLQPFRGRQCSEHFVSVDPFDGILKAKMHRDDINVNLAEQQPIVSFNLAISRDNLLAINSEYTKTI